MKRNRVVKQDWSLGDWLIILGLTFVVVLMLYISADIHRQLKEVGDIMADTNNRANATLHSMEESRDIIHDIRRDARDIRFDITTAKGMREDKARRFRSEAEKPPSATKEQKK